MSLPKNITFGLPSVPRQTMPSMYQILSWDDGNNQNIAKQVQTQTIQPPSNNLYQTQNEKKAQQIQDNIIENISEVKSEHPKCVGKRVSKSCTKHYQLYEYRQARGKAQSQSHRTSTVHKIQTSQVAKPSPKKLDPKNETDRHEIQARKKRIKTFQLVTRDLPNSAFTTYYGKPAFQAYGRGGSNPNLLSHNVMPHKGDNHPKSVQSYYSALIKGKRTSSGAYVTHVPRKPIQQKTSQIPKNQQEIINLALQKPDLINNVRFTSADPREKKDNQIPSNKVTLLKQKIAKKSVRKQKKQKAKSRQKQKADLDDGLKYMNTRDNLLKIIEEKKNNSSKLAYKVTECYPCEWEDEEKLKESTKLWENTKVAGVPSKKSDKVSDLLRICKESPV